MSADKFKPLQYNSEKGEPFLRLRAPYHNIILTPPRLEDIETVVPLLNDPKVYKFLSGPPYPYLLEHSVEYRGVVTSQSDSLIKEIISKEVGAIMGACPVRILREVQPDGTELFLGDVAVIRHQWPELDDEIQREILKAENLSRDVGDPEIVWSFGGMRRPNKLLLDLKGYPDWIRGSHQGRGIMTIAVGELMKQWLIPRMNVRRMHVLTFAGNRGSVRVFEKNGFVLTETIKLVREGPGFGRIEGMHVLNWRLDDQ